MPTRQQVNTAAERNKGPILDVLKRYICSKSNRRLLEISSGMGQHVAHFAPHFPNVTFYPSEYEPELLERIAMNTKELKNVAQPTLIDISTDFQTWPSNEFRENSFDYVYCANLVHVSQWKCSEGLFKNAGQLLKDQGLLITYGAYAVDGKLVPESNVKFNQDLKMENPEWGIRDVKDLMKLAEINGIQLLQSIDMPTNNKTLVWQKIARS